MPSMVIDAAAAAALGEVDNAISNIKNNLSSKDKRSGKLAPSSSYRHQDYSSSLFRDEVVQQEMRYFDEVLRADNGVGGCGYNLPPYKPSQSLGEQVEGGSSDITTHQPRQNSTPNRTSNASHCPTSNQRQRPTSQKKRHVRSRNTRHQANRRLIQRAKLSSRKVMRKLSGIGNSCSKKWGFVSNVIHNQILVAMSSMSSLIENGISQQQRRSYGQAPASQHQMENTASSSNNVQTNDGDIRSSWRSPLRAPPQKCFSDMSLWFKSRTQNISSKAIAKAKASIHSRDKSFAFLV